MVGWGIFLIIIGAGSLLLPQLGFQFRLMELLDDYQPYAGIVVAIIGAGLVLLGHEPWVDDDGADERGTGRPVAGGRGGQTPRWPGAKLRIRPAVPDRAAFPLRAVGNGQRQRRPLDVEAHAEQLGRAWRLDLRASVTTAGTAISPRGTSRRTCGPTSATARSATAQKSIPSCVVNGPPRSKAGRPLRHRDAPGSTGEPIGWRNDARSARAARLHSAPT